MTGKVKGRRWTAEHDTMLKILWSGGKSASECAAEINAVFGSAYTRNGVIGRVHRLGVQHRVTGFVKASAPKKVQKLKLKPAPAVPTASGRIVCEPVADSPRQVGGAEVTLLGLTFRSCRYPLGDPLDESFRFCGAPRKSGAYCKLHAELCYRPTPKRTAAEAALAKAERAKLLKGPLALRP